MANLLIVDDEQSMRQLLTLFFKRAGYETRAAHNGEEALELLRREPVDIILSDIKMPDMDGIRLLQAAREMLPDVGVVMMTAFATIDSARDAFKLGADDFVQKPFDMEELKVIVAKVRERLDLVKENRALKRAQSERGRLDRIIGHSSRMQAVYQMIEMVAAVQSTILITGESGTGKELVARAIHQLSPRAEKPFVPINCGAFAETLLESELFGYVRGAFTGAMSNRKGLFEAAHQGTIFLDEIADTSPAMQVKLLRALQERRIRPVGSHDEIEIDTRVIAATNRELSTLIKQGTFREDLFYRISVIPIELPPLRERREDIPDLVHHFLEKFCAQINRSLSISSQAMELLERYSWPGNVRELEHTIERAVALERTDTVQPERLPEQISKYDRIRQLDHATLPDEGINLAAYLEHLEKTYLLEALQKTGGNQTKAAEMLNMSVRSFRHLLDKHGVRNLTAQIREAVNSATEARP
ncbi:MAG: sigma-54 dependent transcriptional regulator [Pyrinomonadaceae bacterium]